MDIENFYNVLKQRVLEAGFNDNNLSIDQLKDGTYNFAYEECQIGRIKFGKRSSKMQIIDADNVTWLENQPIETYIENIAKWIEYIRFIKAEREKYGIW